MTSMKIGGGGTYERMAQLKRQFDEARADAGKSAGSSPFPAVSAGAVADSAKIGHSISWMMRCRAPPSSPFRLCTSSNTA